MTATPSQTVGPFFAIGLSRGEQSVLDPEGVQLAGTLYDGRGEPIGDGVIEVWDAAGRRWGRAGTDAAGRFRFLVPRDCAVLEAHVFARGLLRHQRTRIHFDGSASEHPSLVVLPDGDGFLFDIRMQGDRATLFFAQ